MRDKNEATMKLSPDEDSDSKPTKSTNSLIVALTVCEGLPLSEAEGIRIEKYEDISFTNEEANQLATLGQRISEQINVELSKTVVIGIPSEFRHLFAQAPPEEEALVAQASELIKRYGPKKKRRPEVKRGRKRS